MTEEAKKKGLLGAALDFIAPPIDDKTKAASTPTTNSEKVINKPVPVVATQIDQDMYNSIMESLKNRGKIFHSFMEKSDAMKSFIPDEVARLKATSLAMSVSKEALLSAVNEIRTGLTIEKGEFNSEIEKAQKVNDGLMLNLQSVEKQISDLDEKIKTLQEKKDSLSSDIKEKQMKVEDTRKIFDATIELINSEIDSFESKVNYI